MRFLEAHGYEAGPTQKPMLAGLLAGALGILPTAGVLAWSGSLDALAAALAMTRGPALLLIAATLAAAGVLYGRIFQRAANDQRGGWLFGLGFGFLLWMAGPVTGLQWAIGRPLATGVAALGFLTAHLLWGLCLGLCFPHVHRPLQQSLEGSPHLIGRETPRKL